LNPKLKREIVGIEEIREIREIREITRMTIE